MTTHHLQGSLFDQTDEVRLGPLDGLRRTASAREPGSTCSPGG